MIFSFVVEVWRFIPLVRMSNYQFWYANRFSSASEMVFRFIEGNHACFVTVAELEEHWLLHAKSFRFIRHRFPASKIDYRIVVFGRSFLLSRKIIKILQVDFVWTLTNRFPLIRGEHSMSHSFNLHEVLLVLDQCSHTSGE